MEDSKQKIPNQSKYIKAAIIQLLVHKYYEQQNNKMVLMYGELINDIDVFSKEITNLFTDENKYDSKPVIGVFLEDLKTQGCDYVETLEIKNETIENFKIDHVQRLISKCPYLENTKIKLVIVPTDYNFDGIEKLKRCQELKNKVLSKIKTDNDKKHLIDYIMKTNNKKSIFEVLSDLNRNFDKIKLKTVNIDNFETMFNNFIKIDFVVLEFEELEKTVKLDEKFLFDYYRTLSIYDYLRS